MRGPRPTPCTFPNGFLQEARQLIRCRTAQVQEVQRCLLVVVLHDEPELSNEAAACCVGLSSRQVRRWRHRWSHGDFSISDLPGRGRKVSFSPSGSSSGHGYRM